MAAVSPATYALLGLLASRSWTGYELTQQARRSVRFVWPTSEAHLYREQTRLVDLGWASVEDEAVGGRTRKRYAITEDGRKALRSWLATPPQDVQFHIEGILRVFYADSGETADLAASLRATAQSAREMQGELARYAQEYLEPEGPMSMLESGVGGPDQRLQFHGRPMFPERLHVVALAMEATARLLDTLGEFCEDTAREISSWPATTEPSVTGETRRRLTEVAG